MAYEISIDPTSKLPTQISIVLTGSLQSSDEAFRCEIVYSLSGFGAVSAPEIPGEAARYLR